ncbi:MAG: polysaccharide biosynthesis/export family protein, partial [Planctomycetaceae bacterium]|nr:polysaccharide biosynthesis/export family protein [Planctomycetaceae bacterium]
MRLQPHRTLCLPAGSAAWVFLGFLCLALTGCRGPNHFLAREMPSGLRVAERYNPQEVDLTKLGSGGNSQLIGSGDVLKVAIAAGLSDDDVVEIPVSISDDGTSSIPEVGRIRLAGLEPQAAESVIRQELVRRGLFQSPTVTVTMSHVRENRIRVIGAVKAPGLYNLHPTSSDVVSALAAAGGLAEDASEDIEIRNPHA